MFASKQLANSGSELFDEQVCSTVFKVKEDFIKNSVDIWKIKRSEGRHDIRLNNHLKGKRNLKTFQSSSEARKSQPKGETLIHYAWIWECNSLHQYKEAPKCHLSFVLIILFQKNFQTVMVKKSPKSAKKRSWKKTWVFERWFQLLKASHEDWMFGLYRFFLKFVRRYDIIGQVIVTLWFTLLQFLLFEWSGITEEGSRDPLGVNSCRLGTSSISRLWNVLGLEDVWVEEVRRRERVPEFESSVWWGSFETRF